MYAKFLNIFITFSGIKMKMSAIALNLTIKTIGECIPMLSNSFQPYFSSHIFPVFDHSVYPAFYKDQDKT